MLTVKFIERDNFRTMVKVEKTVAEAAEKGTQATVDAIIADIQSSWSGTIPSARGNAPAYRTGVLNDSIVGETQGRDQEGRFAGKDALVMYIHFDTSDNDPDGQNYAMALEDPEYLDRPFIAPALERAAGYYTSNIQRFIRG